MGKRAKFSELASGTRFDYEGRMYRKLRMNLAKDEGKVRVLFPSELEVGIVEMDEGRAPGLRVIDG
jgi:hypothetical protein